MVDCVTVLMGFYGYVYFKIKEKRNENNDKTGKLSKARPAICVRAFRFHRPPPLERSLPHFSWYYS